MKEVLYIIYDPEGKPSAAFNHIELFVKGLKQNGVDASIFKLRSPYNINRLLRVFVLIYAAIKVYVRFFLRKDLTIVVYGSNYLWPLFILPRKSFIIVERNEFPDFLINRTNQNNDRLLKYLIHVDGFITCSNNLKNYYSDYLKKNCPILVSPAIVDVDLFHLGLPRIDKVSYCGDWNNGKDGVEILVQSFAKMHLKYPDIRLELIGGGTVNVEENLKIMIEQLGIKRVVDIAGRIPHDEMPKHLSCASILALARPNNKQAQGGFPSKVAEYLATERPVVLTNVGELSLYLQDRVN